MIKLAAWNTRGMNDPLKHRELSTLVKVHSLNVVCILETRVRIHNRVRIFNSILPGWEMHHNYDHAELGRIWVCWNPRVVKVNAILCNDQAIFCHISILSDNSSFFCSAIYASNNQVNRRALWSHLQLCASRVGYEPWFLMGDFNTTRFASEKNGGNMSTDTAMEEFHECLFKLELDDTFQWAFVHMDKPRVGDQSIARKLDRSLQNECALDMFPCAMTEVLNPGLSDHCPLIVNLNNSDDARPRRRCPFKFFNFWADHPSFIDMVKVAWDIDVYGTPMYRLTQKLRSVKNHLKAFNFHVFSNVQEKVEEARGTLYRAQADLLSKPNDPGLVLNEKICMKNFQELARAEEGFLQQKSRIQWLKLGDHNSNFFHKSVKARNSRNSIKSITLENGCRIEDPASIRQEFVNHFQTVLGSNMQDTTTAEYNLDGLVWSSDHLDILNSTITHEEIKRSMFSIDSNKAPGSDGFSSLFFKRTWSIVGREVCEAIADFFSSGCMLREINCTIIALVPKVPNPSSMHDYRPISCCNTIYKCISKIIVTRIKRCLPYIISPAQAAFVHGCSIADNILLTQELMKNYHLDSGPPRCALKIDLMKAYDSIR